VTFKQGGGGPKHLEANHLEPGPLEPAQDFAGQPSLDAVRLQEDEGPFVPCV
jgi:hypothetical protein